MTIAKRILILIAAVLALGVSASPALHAQTQSQPPKTEQQNEFIPLDQLPPQDQLPAPRLLIAAYSFVLAALFVYVVSVSKRIGTVRREVERLEADLKRTGRA